MAMILLSYINKLSVYGAFPQKLISKLKDWFKRHGNIKWRVDHWVDFVPGWS